MEFAIFLQRIDDRPLTHDVVSAHVAGLRHLDEQGRLIAAGPLADGTGGPRDAAVLYGPDDVLADLDAAGVVVTVERADVVARPVEGAERPALDCLVRVRR